MAAKSSARKTQNGQRKSKSLLDRTRDAATATLETGQRRRWINRGIELQLRNLKSHRAET